MKYTALALVLLLLVGCSGHQAPSDPSTGGVHLSVRADPRQGFAPLHVTFHVNLTGVAENDQNFYCLREEWDFGDGAVSSEAPNCEPFSADTKIAREFFADHVFNNTGIYAVRFKLGDHKASPVSINVLENRTGAGPGK